MLIKYHDKVNTSHITIYIFTFNIFFKALQYILCHSQYVSPPVSTYGPDHTQSQMRSRPRGHDKEVRQFTKNNWGQLEFAQLPNSADLLLLIRSRPNH